MTDVPTILFRLGRAILALDPNPLSREEAGTWIGKLRKTFKDDGAVANLLARYAQERPAMPQEWLAGAIRRHNEAKALERPQSHQAGLEAELRRNGIDPHIHLSSLSKDEFKRRLEIERRYRNMPNQPATAGRSASAVADR